MIENSEWLERAFGGIGSSIVVAPARQRTRRYSLDIETDRHRRERFVLRTAGESPSEAMVLHQDRARRHLLLLVRDRNEDGTMQNHRYLCGHDERHWFVAAVPNGKCAPTTVTAAMEALRPAALERAALAIPARRRNRRHNQAFIRQGEWFFVPVPSVTVDPRAIRRNEGLSRGRGKLHMAEELVRTGGTIMYVCRRFPLGITEGRYRELLRFDPSVKGYRWTTMRANPEVLVRGRISHPDHATIVLRDWHRVYLSREGAAPWAEAVVFLD